MVNVKMENVFEIQDSLAEIVVRRPHHLSLK